MAKTISRKEFFRSFGIGSSGATGEETREPGTPDRANDGPGAWGGDGDHRGDETKEPGTRRGSWLLADRTAGEGIVLARDGAGCRIVLPESAHSSVKQAAKFLAADIKKISGFQPDLYLNVKPSNAGQPPLKLWQQGSNPAAGGRLSAAEGHHSPATIYLATLGEDEVPAEMDLSDIKNKWEAHRIITTNNAVWLIGADFRGTAFAVYTFCERIGIDPLYLWTGYEPGRQETLVVKEIDYSVPSPVFRYRGFFHDDEDILPRPFEQSGYPLRTGDIGLEWYKKYFETALRLRMNMVAPYTRVHRRYEVQRCASEWGLFYTSHHYDILLSNPFGFEIFKLAEKRNIKPEWNWFTNKQGMMDYWRAGVWENKDLDCIWPVGLRGLGDRAYPFPEDSTKKDQDEVFTAVINAQADAVKKMLPCRLPPIYTFTLYREMYEKYNSGEGSFPIPEDVIIVWSDNNAGVMDRLPEKLGKWKHGVYYHLAVTGFDATIQSTHIVSPYTIMQEFKKVMDSGATEYMLVNVSELREFVMEARLLADIGWDAGAVLYKEEPAREYIAWWSREYFGPKSVKDAAKVYEQYYKLLTRSTSLWLAADMIWQMLEQLVKKFAGKPFQETEDGDILRLKERDREYRRAMDYYSKATKAMGALQSQYFFEHTRLGLSFDWRPTQAALLLCQALKEQDTGKAWEYVYQSIKPLEELELEILRAERPPFSDWYRETWIRRTLSNHNVHRSYNLVRTFISSRGKEFRSPGSRGRANIPQYQAWSEFLDSQDGQ